MEGRRRSDAQEGHVLSRTPTCEIVSPLAQPVLPLMLIRPNEHALRSSTMPCASFCGCGTQGSPTATSSRPTCSARLEPAAALAGLRRPTGATCAPRPMAPAVESSPAGGRSERPAQRALTPPSKGCGIRCLAATTAGRWLGAGSQPPRRRRGRPYLLMLLSCCLGCWVRVAGEQNRDRPLLKSSGSRLPRNAERVPRT
jgi:hypothetical protein